MTVTWIGMFRVGAATALNFTASSPDRALKMPARSPRPGMGVLGRALVRGVFQPRRRRHALRVWWAMSGLGQSPTLKVPLQRRCHRDRIRRAWRALLQTSLPETSSPPSNDSRYAHPSAHRICDVHLR